MTRDPFTCPLCGYEGDFETECLPDTIECGGCGQELCVEYWMGYTVYPRKETTK